MWFVLLRLGSVLVSICLSKQYKTCTTVSAFRQGFLAAEAQVEAVTPEMTVTYTARVAKARFCGFSKLLLAWKGSIYKVLYKEFLAFFAMYTAISITYRCVCDL